MAKKRNAKTLLAMVVLFFFGVVAEAYVIVDDMDSYGPDPALRNVWKDSITGTLAKNGAELFVETDANFTRDANSMKYYYRNRTTTGPNPDGSTAEANTVDLEVGSDWTVGDVKALTLYFCGDTANGQEDHAQYTIANDRLWISLLDGSSNEGIMRLLDMNDVTDGEWHTWNISLRDPNFSGVDMNNVAKVYIGFGGVKGGADTKYGAGYQDLIGDTVWFDDIRLYPPRCMPEKTGIDVLHGLGDFTEDCITDYSDFNVMAREWLISDYEGAPQPPAAPIIEYLFDEGSGDTVYNTGGYTDPNYDLTIGLYLDANGNSLIHPNHAPQWADDPCRGWCLFFDGEGGMWPGVAPIPSEQFLGGDYLVMPALNLQTDTFSITAWIKPNPTFRKTADEFKGAFTGIVTTRKHPSINPSVGTGAAGLHYGFGGFTYDKMLAYTWNNDGPDTWNWDSDIFPVDLEWNFVAVTIAPDQATIYDVNESAGALEIAANVIPHSSDLLDAKWIIAGDIDHLRFFKGWMDDIRIYDYTLSTGEIMNLAGVEGIVYFPNRSVANIVPKTPPPENYDPNNPDIVNFLDYSILADNWLKEHMWPPEP